MPIHKCTLKTTTGKSFTYYLKCETEEQLIKMLMCCKGALTNIVAYSNLEFEPDIEVEIVDEFPKQEWVDGIERS